MTSYLLATSWMLTVLLTETVSLAESPELQLLPTLENQQIHLADEGAQLRQGVCENNGTAIFLRLLNDMHTTCNTKTSASPKDRAGRSISMHWSAYFSPLLEFFYHDDTRSSVFTNSADDKSSSPMEGERKTDQHSIKHSNQRPQRANCTLRQNYTEESSAVMLVNDTSLQQFLKNEKAGNGTTEVIGSAQCQILLLFAPWCPFSALLAPHYNALGRIFPDLEALAINAVTLNYWNARFGTVAVPNVLLFHNGKFIAKYNCTEKTIGTLTHFVQNHTNLNASEQVELVEDDYLGPVPTELVQQTDFYLWLSWAVIIYAFAFGCYKYSTPLTGIGNYITNLFHYDHNHLD